MPERPLGILTPLAAGRMWAVLWMALAAGGPREPAVADDVVIEEERAEEAAGAEAEKAAEQVIVKVLESSARHLPLGWTGRKLGIDRHGIRARLLTPEVARARDAMAAAIKRAERLLVEEAATNGVARDQAEQVFGNLGEALARRDQFDEALRPLVQPWSDNELLGVAFGKVADDAEKHCKNGGWRGGSNDGMSFSFEPLEGEYESHGEGCQLSLKESGPRKRSLRMVEAAGDLSIVWQAEAGADGTDDEYVRLSQTAAGLRMVHVRDGDVVLRLQGESFRDCCRVNSEAVRREFVPLLRRIGVGPPAMPDDERVKQEVLVRLRKAAGVAEPKAGGPDGENLESGKHLIAQASAVIDAFGLLDDADYLGGLKATATGDDAAAIERRLAALAAGK